MNATTESTDVVKVTESAAAQLKSMMENDPESKGKFLRVYVEAGGCSGMQYGMTFDEKRADDLASEISGVTVLVDSFSSNYLRGSVVDYIDSLSGGGFKISNPNAKQSCGCGKSFEA